MNYQPIDGFKSWLKWFDPWWYKYLLSGCTGLRNFICRIDGHSCGAIWFSLYNNEPNMHCKNCGEDLG